MKGLLRPLLVGGLSIAIGGTGLLGGGAAFAAGGAAPASVTATVSPTIVVEGDMVTLTVQLDSDATEQLGVQVNWGDAAPIDFVFINPGVKLVDPPLTHKYTDNAPKGTRQGSITINVRAENATTSLTASANVTVKNAPPTMTGLAVTPATITAGEAATVAGTFADLGKADRHSVMVDWGDGDTTMYPRLLAKTYNFSYAHSYPVGGTYTITPRVTDDDTGWVEGSVALTVLSTNVAPSGLMLGMSAVAEGGVSTLTATFTDPDATDTHNVTVNWGDASGVDVLPTLAAGVKSFSPAHTYSNTGSYTVTVVLNDSAGHSITGTTSVSVSNVAPSVALAAVASPIAGDNLDLTGTFTDPGTADTFSLSVDWGDATAKGAPVLGADGRSFTASHTYTVEGSYPVTVTVTDRDAASGSASATVVVRHRNIPPTSLTLSTPAVAQGASTTLTGAFSDPDASDAHSVVVSWGDGTPSTTVSLAPGTTSLTTTHGYASAGTWTVSATVTDSAAASTSATTQAVVTAPTTTAALFDELTAVVQSFSLDRATERWFLHRLEELKSARAAGSAEFCDALSGLDRLSSVARRTLTADQIAALSELTTKLQASAHCSPTGDETGQHENPIVTPQKATTPTAPKPAAQKEAGNQNDQNTNDQKKNDAVKSEQSKQTNQDRGNSTKGARHSQANN